MLRNAHDEEEHWKENFNQQTHYVTCLCICEFLFYVILCHLGGDNVLFVFVLLGTDCRHLCGSCTFGIRTLSGQICSAGGVFGGGSVCSLVVFVTPIGFPSANTFIFFL